MPLRGGIAARDEDAPVGDVRVRRPHLLAVDDEVRSLEPRARPHRREVGSGVAAPRSPGTRSPRPERMGCEVARLLGVGAVRDDRRPGHPEPDHAEVLRRLGPRELLEEDRLVAVRLAAAAVLLRPGEPDCSPPRRARDSSRGSRRPSSAPRRRGARAARRHVRLEPGAELAAELLLVGRVAEIHGAILDVGRRGASAHRLNRGFTRLRRRPCLRSVERRSHREGGADVNSRDPAAQPEPADHRDAAGGGARRDQAGHRRPGRDARARARLPRRGRPPPDRGRARASRRR